MSSPRMGPPELVRDAVTNRQIGGVASLGSGNEKQRRIAETETPHMADIKAQTETLIAGINEGNLGVIDELFHDDFVEHEELPPGIPDGKEAPRAMFSMLLSAFPDFHYTVEEMLQDGAKVVVRARFSGTHDGGEFMGIPETGNRFDIAVIDIMEYSGDRLIGHWGVIDRAAMIEQLGAGEPPQG